MTLAKVTGSSKPIIIGSLIYAVVVGFILQSVVGLYHNQQQFEQKQRLTQHLWLVAANLEAAVYSDVFVADSLTSILTINPDNTLKHWNDIAKRLMVKARFARNIGVAPNNVISHVYPIEGNEQAIGFDYRSSPNQMATVQKAIDIKDVFIAGPLNLVQGGLGLIIRIPVFSDYPNNETYWGIASVVIEFEKLITFSDFHSDPAMQLALRRVDKANSIHTHIYGDRQSSERPDVIKDIYLPNTHWQLTGRFVQSSSLGTLTTVVLVTLILLAIALYTAAFMFYKSYRLAQKHSLHDELTGMPNRRYLMQTLTKLTDPDRPHKFAVVNIDLNGFKQINDTYGHDAGDAVLVHVGHAITRQLRHSDMVARLGGDEFILLLYRLSDKQKIQSIVDSLKMHFEQHPFNWRGQTIPLSLSAGFAVYDEDPVEIKDLLAKADQKMYQDKHGEHEH